MYKSKNPMINLPEELVQQIKQIPDFQLDELISVVSHRFNQLRLGREGFFVVLSREPSLRRREIEYMTQDLIKNL